MTVTLQATNDHDTISAIFKCLEQKRFINPAGAGQHYDTNGWGVGASFRTCQVGGSVCSMFTGKDDDTCIKVTHHLTPLASAVFGSAYAFIFAVIFLSSNLPNDIVLAGHSATQMPQPWHNAGLISAVC